MWNGLWNGLWSFNWFCYEAIYLLAYALPCIGLQSCILLRVIRVKSHTNTSEDASICTYRVVLQAIKDITVEGTNEA